MRGCSCRGTAGFAHVSCLAEQAKILVAEARRTIWTCKVKNEVVAGGTRAACASKSTTASCGARSGGRAGRRRGAAGDRQASGMAMNVLGNGLSMQITTRTRCR